MPGSCARAQKACLSTLGLTPKGDDRIAAVTAAWIGAPAVSLMVRCFYHWQKLFKHYEAGNLATIIYFNKEELDSLKPTMVAQIIDAATKGSLGKTPLLDLVMYFLDQHDPAALAPIVGQLAKTDEGAADLAVAALGHRPLLTTNPVDRSDVARLEKWTVMTKDALIVRFRNLLANRPAWLLEIHQIALTAFIGEVEHPRDAVADGIEN